MHHKPKISMVAVGVTGGVFVILMLVLGTMWMSNGASHDTQEAVRQVSRFYLDELADRRGQVVASNLSDNIEKVRIAVGSMTADSRKDLTSLRAYQGQIITLFGLSRFAFMDTEGTVYTYDDGRREPAPGEFRFDAHLERPMIYASSLDTDQKRVIIAVPIAEPFEVEGHTMKVCFIERSVQTLTEGVSMQPDKDSATFCNLYNADGIPLTSMVLGGQSTASTLMEALEGATFEKGKSLDGIIQDFRERRSGVVSFVVHYPSGDISETLSYAPVHHTDENPEDSFETDWFLTYMIRDSVLSERIHGISEVILHRCLLLSLLTALILLIMFTFMIWQIRKNAKLSLEKETAAAASQIKQQEMEYRLSLQEQLLEQEKQRTEQENMIKALAADYWSVYYLDLDRDEGICYQSHEDLDHGFKVGERFPYLSSVTAYANEYVTDAYREEFLRFIQPDNVKKELKDERVISFRYLVFRHGHESWEMVRFAGVSHPKDLGDHLVHAVGACFTNVDAETRKTLLQSQTLNDALHAAEQASKAKTAFLSNMSHEIRTPMNAIIGLDAIALNDPTISPQTREYLEKIGTSAHHLLGLINDILDMSRIESGKMTLKNETFSFARLLEQINTIFSGQCQDKGLDYRCRVIGTVNDWYIGDDMKLRQVLINLLGNAVKFTPEGGRVDFSVECTARFDSKSTLRFIVADTGIGMSADYLPRIFDTFSQEDSSATNRFGSSGLGLAITKNIVEMMNGSITVESEKGKGSTFTVTVTLTDADDASAGQNGGTFNPSALKVLVVDDDPVACDHAKLELEKAGIASDTVLSGAQAVDMVRLHHARRDPYGLILVDLKMPEMDGVEVSRQIRGIAGNESAIIILTAYRWDDVYDEALQAGVDSFLPKPLFAANVVEEFRGALAKKNLLGKLAPRKAELKGRHILLAEDIQINAEIMTMVLQSREMTVDVAENGKIAVEKFESQPEGTYDAILMDMRMPEMDGLEATARIRAMDRGDAKTVPIIALTANAFDEDVQRSLQAGLNAHLSKPVDPDSLYEALESLIPT